MQYSADLLSLRLHAADVEHAERELELRRRAEERDDDAAPAARRRRAPLLQRLALR